MATGIADAQLVFPPLSARAPLLAAKQVIGSGRQEKDRTNAPDDAVSSRLLRREEQTLRDVTQSELTS